MCGIIGYVGSGRASEILTEGLKRLEYRGYDSVGIAVSKDGNMDLRKDKGMIDVVSDRMEFARVDGNIGIGHTRWATHGAVCKENSHPHLDCSGKIAIAHNGVIENYLDLKKELEPLGHKFASGTDSEVVAHLIEEYAKSLTFKSAFLKMVSRLHGSYAIVAFDARDGARSIYLARRNSPLVLGVGKGEMLCASDIPAMLKYTKTFVPLEENDVAVLSKNGYEVLSSDGKKLDDNSRAVRKQITVDWSAEMAQKGGYPHFMLKEINDQKHNLNDTLATDTTDAVYLIKNHEKIHILGCGTSFHAGLFLSYLLQENGKAAQAYIASDYPFIAKPDKQTLIIAMSQSGETADVLQALRFAKDAGARVIGVTNVIGSSITSLAECTVFMNTGPEVGVAATKTFTAQLAIACKLASNRERLEGLSNLIDSMVGLDPQVRSVAAKLADKSDVFFLARGKCVPIAYEGSLKFKEITYIHSEAYPGGELKHGTLSLITDGVPVIALGPKDITLPKLFGNIKEAKARGGMIISLTDDDALASESDLVIRIPSVKDPLLYPFALIVPLQLLAYHVSVLRGINPDRPRNLAKSVTVE